jgi:hypothetical protein
VITCFNIGRVNRLWSYAVLQTRAGTAPVPEWDIPELAEATQLSKERDERDNHARVLARQQLNARDDAACAPASKGAKAKAQSVPKKNSATAAPTSIALPGHSGKASARDIAGAVGVASAKPTGSAKSTGSAKPTGIAKSSTSGKSRGVNHPESSPAHSLVGSAAPNSASDKAAVPSTASNGARGRNLTRAAGQQRGRSATQDTPPAKCRVPSELLMEASYGAGDGTDAAPAVCVRGEGNGGADLPLKRARHPAPTALVSSDATADTGVPARAKRAKREANAPPTAVAQPVVKAKIKAKPTAVESLGTDETITAPKPVVGAAAAAAAKKAAAGGGSAKSGGSTSGAKSKPAATAKDLELTPKPFFKTPAAAKKATSAVARGSGSARSGGLASRTKSAVVATPSTVETITTLPDTITMRAHTPSEQRVGMRSSGHPSTAAKSAPFGSSAKTDRGNTAKSRFSNASSVGSANSRGSTRSASAEAAALGTAATRAALTRAAAQNTAKANRAAAKSAAAATSGGAADAVVPRTRRTRDAPEPTGAVKRARK